MNYLIIIAREQTEESSDNPNRKSCTEMSQDLGMSKSS